MAILKIARMGHPVLRRHADLVVDPSAPAIQLLVQDMKETMADAGGLGLAAPQVHVPLRVVMFHVPPDGVDREAMRDQPMPLTVLVNPEIEPIGDEQDLGWEGCLSVPGLRGKVPRHVRIKYRGFTPDGSFIEREASGLHARVVQHECDHLDGVLYPARMIDMGDLLFETEWKYWLKPGDVVEDDE